MNRVQINVYHQYVWFLILRLLVPSFAVCTGRQEGMVWVWCELDLVQDRCHRNKKLNWLEVGFIFGMLLYLSLSVITEFTTPNSWWETVVWVGIKTPVGLSLATGKESQGISLMISSALGFLKKLLIEVNISCDIKLSSKESFPFLGECQCVC